MSRDGRQHSTCCCQSGICWLRIDFYVPYLNKVLKMVSFSFHSTHTNTFILGQTCVGKAENTVFWMLFQVIFSARVITIAHILLAYPTSKSWLHGFRCGKQGGHIPLIINPSPEMPLHNTQNYLYCLAAKKGIHSVIIGKVIQKMVLEHVQCYCVSLWSQKKMGPIILPALIAHRTQTL